MAIGVAGITWDSPLLAVRVADGEGQATSREVASGILWAAGQGAKVINVSFAPLWSNEVVRAAVQQAYHRGSLVMISAGNEGGMRGASGYDEALFVGAVDGSNRIAGFSDRGPFVDLVAPGVEIRTTGDGGGYRLATGTSFATPIVAGVAALAWSVNPDLRPITMTEILTDSAADLGARGDDSTYGAGVVDATAAVELARETEASRDDTPPTLSVTRPTNGANMSGRYTVRATAADRYGVADVVLYVDGIPFATDTRSPYRFVVDTSDFTTGSHELVLIATDHAGNESEVVSVNVMFGSSVFGGSGSSQGVAFEAPAAGSRVSGNVSIDAVVTAAAGLATVEWLIDGESVFVTPVTGSTSQVNYLWRTAGASRGSHTVTVIATDMNGDQSTGHIELVKR